MTIWRQIITRLLENGVAEATWSPLESDEILEERLVTGSSREVMVSVGLEVVEVYEWAAYWSGPGELEADPRLVGRVPLEDEVAPLELDTILEALEHLVSAPSLGLMWAFEKSRAGFNEAEHRVRLVGRCRSAA